jgi:signal recognition particle receptor subunit beta
VVDAASLSSSGGEAGVEGGLTEAASYLHDVLLLLQKRGLSTKGAPKELPVLIAANKSDLFTALPATLAKSALENEITKIRASRAKGLLDSGIGMDEADGEEDHEWLGETAGAGGGKFMFSQMEDVNVSISVERGSVFGGSSEDGSDVGRWWDWIGKQL